MQTMSEFSAKQIQIVILVLKSHCKSNPVTSYIDVFHYLLRCMGSFQLLNTRKQISKTIRGYSILPQYPRIAWIRIDIWKNAVPYIWNGRLEELYEEKSIKRSAGASVLGLVTKVCGPDLWTGLVKLASERYTQLEHFYGLTCVWFVEKFDYKSR